MSAYVAAAEQLYEKTGVIYDLQDPEVLARFEAAKTGFVSQTLLSHLVDTLGTNAPQNKPTLRHILYSNCSSQSLVLKYNQVRDVERIVLTRVMGQTDVGDTHVFFSIGATHLQTRLPEYVIKKTTTAFLEEPNLVLLENAKVHELTFYCETPLNEKPELAVRFEVLTVLKS